MTGEYLVGRRVTQLTPDKGSYEDAIFPGMRLDGTKFANLRISHSTFANNSLKNSTWTSCFFENVVFIGVYFRDARLDNCVFRGCKFIDCDLSRADLRSCDIRYYNKFVRSPVPFDRIADCLPVEGNLLHLLANNLARESAAVGSYDDAARFRAAASRGERRFHLAVARRGSPYYRDKYDISDSLRSITKLIGIWIFNFLWGGARSHWVVVRNWLFLAGFAFALFSTVGPESLGGGISWWRAGAYGALATIPIAPPYELRPSGPVVPVLLVVFRFLGLMFSAILAALVFARVYEGRR